jgi:L-aminopeptidase/D-esterase-like protein
MIEHLPAPGLPLRVGHWTHPGGATGCTVVLCERGAWASGEVRGAAPGTRETDVLRPGGLVGQAHAILLAGGSAPGLAAADGVSRWLRARGAGYRVAAGIPPVPIVPAAVIFDLGAALGVYPDAEAGRLACEAAQEPAAAVGPRIGAGAGAAVGKAGGPALASPAGLGQATLRAGAVVVWALLVVNAFGEVRDPATGAIVAGVRNPAGGFTPTLDLLGAGGAAAGAAPNTTIGVVATNVALDPTALGVVARMANSGLARAVTPAHTMYDGDTLFTLSLAGDSPAPARPDPALVTLVGALGAEAVIGAVLQAVTPP